MPSTDFDPEAEVADARDDSSDEESVDENAGTEHYVSVGYENPEKVMSSITMY